MIYVRLYGGLGNQLFQYATARAVALRLGVGLGMDCRYLDGKPAHMRFALGPFAIEAECDPTGLPPDSRRQPLRYELWRIGHWSSPRFLRERGLGLNNDVMQAQDGSYLHGYFQTDRYFSDYAEQVRAELRITQPPAGENPVWVDRIAADDRAVSVHLRRGDYLQWAKAEGTHGICDEAYYRKALAEIAERTGIEPRAYVFSDDPDWARANLSLGVETVVAGHNGILQAHEDLRLMALCRHHVIANSTFSWWGAWLDGSPAAVTVAPSRWFASEAIQNPDILPGGWIRI